MLQCYLGKHVLDSDLVYKENVLQCNEIDGVLPYKKKEEPN